MSTSTIAPKPGAHTNGNRRWVRVPHEVHTEQLRRRAGRAYLRLSAGACDVAAAIGLKNHAGASRRRQGLDGPLAPLLSEIEALERAGVDTTPLLEAIIETQLGARGDGRACIRELSAREQELDNAENTAQHRYLSGEPGALEDWIQSLAAYVANAKLAIMAGRSA